MTPTEAAIVLSYCAEAWPNMRIGDDTAIVWADGLAGVDAQDAHTAVRNLAKTDEWAPSLARVITAARGIAASHMTHKALPAPSRADNARVIRAIRAASEAVDRPAHDHRRGAENCPCCTTKDQRIKQFTSDTLGALREAGVIR